MGIRKNAAEGIVEKLTGLSYDIFSIVDAVDDSFEDDVEEPDTTVFQYARDLKQRFDSHASDLRFAIVQTTQDIANDLHVEGDQ